MQVELSPQAHAVICGLVASTFEVDADAIMAPDEVWSEIRAAFPLATFNQSVADGTVDYEPNAE